MRPTVYRLEVQSDDGGVVAHVAVQRFGSAHALPPLAADMPPDLRAALREWLDTAEDHR